MLNVEKKIKGVFVACVWGETPDFAKAAARDGQIPEIVDKKTDMLAKSLPDQQQDHVTYAVSMVVSFFMAFIKSLWRRESLVRM